MTTGSNFQPFLLILVLVILLILLWFLLRNPWKVYAARFTDNVPISQPRKIDWSEISAPDNDGVMFSTGVYELTDSVGKIELTTFGKDDKAIKKFCDEAKFSFQPIFEEIPTQPLSQILNLFSQKDRHAEKSQSAMSNRMAMQGQSSAADRRFEQDKDLLLEIVPNLTSASGAKSAETPVRAITYLIDPSLAAGQSFSYYAWVTGVYDKVYVSAGSVSATLTRSGSTIDSSRIGASGSDVLSSPTYSTQQSFKMTVTGTGGSNTFRSSGTWNVG